MEQINKLNIQKEVIKDTEYRDVQGIKDLITFYSKILAEPYCTKTSYRHNHALEYLRALKAKLKPDSDIYVNMDEFIGVNVYTLILPEVPEIVIVDKKAKVKIEKDSKEVVQPPTMFKPTIPHLSLFK